MKRAPYGRDCLCACSPAGRRKLSFRPERTVRSVPPESVQLEAARILRSGEKKCIGKSSDAFFIHGFCPGLLARSQSFRSTLRFGRRKPNVHRTFCAPSPQKRSRSGSALPPAFTLLQAIVQAAFVPSLRHLREAGYPLTGCVVKPRSGEIGASSVTPRFQAEPSGPAFQDGTRVSAGPRGEEHTDCSTPPGRRSQRWDESACRR